MARLRRASVRAASARSAPSAAAMRAPSPPWRASTSAVGAGGARRVQRGELRLDVAQLGAARARLRARQLRLVEEDRRLVELVEHEEQQPDDEDAELHRQLHQAVEHEAEPRLGQRRARQVALHLRLIGAEVGELHEEAAGDAAPKRVARVEARREVDDLHLAERATDGERVVERDRRRQAMQHEGERRRHAAEHDHHLPGLRAADDARAARDGVER